MDRERYEKACSFFVEAVELDEAERAEYLLKVQSSDAELLPLVEDMLDADREAARMTSAD